MGQFSPDPHVSDMGKFAMARADVQPYSAEADAAIPVGTVIPSIVYDTPFAGDRGDVSANAQWRKTAGGRWKHRASWTGSRFDQPLTNGSYAVGIGV